MPDRRLVGIDLGITSAHTVRVLDGDGATVCRRKALPTTESLGVPPISRRVGYLAPAGEARLPEDSRW
jgi:hypothetical protein